ncbi:MAG: phosphate signaling complex protein PhoU [bacterium]
MPGDYQQELKDLYALVREYGTLAVGLLHDSVEAFNNRVVPQALGVLKQEPHADDLKKDVEKRAIRIITTHLPMAGDMRRIIAIIKASSDLERIADNAVQIAILARDATQKKDPKILDLSEAGEKTVTLIQNALEAFLEENDAKVKAADGIEEEVDTLYKSITRETLTYMSQNPQNIEAAIKVFNISRRLERAADHGENIAEHYTSIIKEETA